MTDLDYRKLYCEIYNNSLTYEKYIPVKDYLYKIIHAYHEAMAEELDFTKDLISFFDIVIDNNNYDNLDNYIDFIININAPWYEVSGFLKVMMFPQEVYLDNRDVYYDEFEYMVKLVKFYLKKDNCKNLNTKIEKIMEVYAKNRNNISFDRVDGSNTLRGRYYDTYAHIITGYFYLLDKPINYLDRILNYCAKKNEEFIAKAQLSGVHDLAYYKSSLGEEAEYIFFEHFVDINGVSNKEIK